MIPPSIAKRIRQLRADAVLDRNTTEHWNSLHPNDPPFDTAFETQLIAREALASGEAIYVSLLTFLQPMHAIRINVGPDQLAVDYGVGVEP